MNDSILAFSLFSLLVAVTPGPDSLLVLRNSVKYGRKEGIRIAAGASVGSLIWGIFSAVGLVAVISASAELYRIVQLVGAVYLVVLGIQSWRSHASNEHESSESVWLVGFRAGFVSNVLNPKVGMFFLAVMPQFIPANGSAAAYSLMFAAIDAVIAFVWLFVVAWLGCRAGAWMQRETVRTALDRVAGTVLIGIGLKVALETQKVAK